MPRLALLRDGTTVGCFTLHHHETHVVVIEPNGHAFSYVGPHGRASRHLTPTLLSSQRPLVREAMRFRNRYAWCAAHTGDGSTDEDEKTIGLPYVHAALGDTRSHTRRRHRGGDSAETLSAAWPRVESYATHTLWNDNDDAQRFEIESLDGTATVQLHASGKVAHAKYLVTLPCEATTGSSDDVVWVHQTFPIGSTPACFAFPVRLLLRARIARGSGADRFRVDSDAQQPTAVALPRNGALRARPMFRRPLSDKGGGGGTGSAVVDEISVETVTRWIRGMSRSLDRLVVVERMDDVDWIVNRDDRTPTVLIITSADATESDGSLIECDRSFFRAVDSRGVVTQQFTVETMPLELRTFSSDYEKTTASLLHAVELFNATCSSSRSDEFHRSPPVHPAPPTILVEDLSNDVGRFRAFSDGRVRVVFADRTILQVAPSAFADDCSFTYRDGSTGHCTNDSGSPMQQQYLNVAMDFAQWAFATPEQRFRRYQLQQEQQLLVARELHKITVRHELNTTTSGVVWPPTSINDASRNQTGDVTALSQDAVAQLQRETTLHMTDVQTLLHEDPHGD